MKSLVRSPMAWILAVVGVLHFVGIGWGLPGSDGWDNDGVAPRDFLPGLADTFTPGHFYTYPPVHLALLAVVTSPVVLVAALRASSFELNAVVAEILKVPYMTTIAYLARFVSFGMSLASTLFIARLAEEIRAHELGVELTDERVRRVGYCTAAFVGANVSFAYYAHTTNLDVPYLFWATWALLTFARAIARQQPKLLRRAFMLAVLAVGTKDQAYALVLLSLPIAFVIWNTADPWARSHRREIIKEAAIALGLAIGLFLVVDAIVFNPSGFVARLHFLTGPASQDFAEYTHDWSGRIAILADFGHLFLLQYAPIVAPVIVLGLALVVKRAWAKRGAQLALALLPLLAVISFTVCFNWSALRTNARFLLPQGLLLAIYGGSAIEAAILAREKALRIGARIATAALGLYAYYGVVSIPVSFLYDPRYDTEAWLREHVKPGETIETYGLNVYLPRFPADAHVVRVGPEPLKGRNPMPGIEEVQGNYEDADSRHAHWIVVPTAWVWRYLKHPDALVLTGRASSPGQSRSATDTATTEFFEHLVFNATAYQVAHVSEYEARTLVPILDVHGTTGKWVWIYERKPDR